GHGGCAGRFMGGTRDRQGPVEQRIAEFVGAEDAILYAACFDANGGVFEPLLGEADAIISDELNHASIIDGIRLCKAKRWRYKNNDMADLAPCLDEADTQGCPQKLVVSDGGVSMDRTGTNLKAPR